MLFQRNGITIIVHTSGIIYPISSPDVWSSGVCHHACVFSLDALLHHHTRVYVHAFTYAWRVTRSRRSRHVAVILFL